MTYKELYCEATRLLEHDQITLGEYEEMTKPLDREIEQEFILDEIRAEIENDWQLKKYPSSPFSCGLRHAIEIIDKHKSKSEVNND